MPRESRFGWILTAAIASLIAAPVFAQEVADMGQSPYLTEIPIAHSEAAPPGSNRVSLPERLDLNELRSSRARATVVMNQQQIDGVVQGNSLGDYTAGEIALSDNALSSFSGVGNFLFNTGAQNNLQAGMTLTVTVEN